MYTPLVVVVEIRGEHFSLARERNALAPVVSSTLCLEGAVEPLDVGVVVRAAQSRVADGNAVCSHPLLEVPTVFRAVVSLHHGEREAEGCLRIENSLSGSSLPEGGGAHGVRHARIEIDDRVVVYPPTSMGIDVMDGIGLYQLTGSGGMRTARVVCPDPFLPSAGKAVVAAENPPYTAERNLNVKYGGDVMPHYFGAAFELGADGKDPLDYLVRYGGRVGVWS